MEKENSDLQVELAQDIDIKYKGEIGPNPNANARKRSTIHPGYSRYRYGERAYVPSEREWKWDEVINAPFKRSSMRSEETVKAMRDGSPWLFERWPFQRISERRSFVEQAKGVPGSQLGVDRKSVSFLKWKSML